MKNIVKKLIETRNEAKINELLCEARDIEAKKYYKADYHQQYSRSHINSVLYGYVMALDIGSIFEFGCNAGRHLNEFSKMGHYELTGIDINEGAVEAAKEQFQLNGVSLGDELTLNNMASKSVDLILTVSVLCHIKNINPIVAQFKRIAKKYIICVETDSKDSGFWFKQNYDKIGFKSIYFDYADEVGCLYRMWVIKL